MHSLGDFARAGFRQLSEARDILLSVSTVTGHASETLLDAFLLAADPDASLMRIAELSEHHPQIVAGLSGQQLRMLALLFGASPALGDFFCRHPQRLVEILAQGGRLISLEELHDELLRAVGTTHEPLEQGTDTMPIASLCGEEGARSLRIRYRELLAEVMLYDLSRGLVGDAADAFEEVSATLSDLASAALEAALAVARSSLIEGLSGPTISRERVRATRFSIIAMGKCGARELNVVSDVDVMFITDPIKGQDSDDMIRIASKLATETMRALHDPGIEPPLWQVDANLRPEGRQGALVRTLSSMLNYYERWAKTWEFQALLKARAVAGDLTLGDEFVRATRGMVWSSASREDFVGNVRQMRERVTEHIDAEELEVQIKLGPGGLRDIEFSVQLLQLVHGQNESKLHHAATLPALAALVDGGYVAREDGDRLSDDYRRLRVLEHRLQLRDLRRTALMPRDEEGLRVLARATRFATSGVELGALWQRIKAEVRELHLKIFYAPLLSAVASLPGEELILDSGRAGARLRTIGFRDPDGALGHLAALTKGSSRAARIQRNLLPVLLQWLADGTDPDFGLLAFRRVSEANRHTPWYLRLLRDGTEAAERLTRVLSSSRFAAELLESIPEAVAWLERDALLVPQPLDALLEEMRALASRRESVDEVAAALRAVHRREILRIALGSLVHVLDDSEVAQGLDSAHTALLDGLLIALFDSNRPDTAQIEVADAAEGLELALIGMGRYGGRELGFASDIDLMAVFRAPKHVPSDAAARTANRIVTELQRLVADPRFSMELDFDLRPEGKSGPLVRSLDAYRSYYERWSVTWETQALLRARPVAGSKRLGLDFIELVNRVRYPLEFTDDQLRDIRRVKARVEAERLPRGADPKRHLKLGPGAISDVEWLVQLMQLRHAAERPELRTESTLIALAVVAEVELLTSEDRAHLEDAWLLASRIRSAIKLWSGRGNDSLPVERSELEGIAGVLGMPRGHTTELEEAWFAASRRSRSVFEREFFGFRQQFGYQS